MTQNRSYSYIECHGQGDMGHMTSHRTCLMIVDGGLLNGDKFIAKITISLQIRELQPKIGFSL